MAYLSHEQICERISALRFKQRRQPLTDAEAAELENLEYRHDLRLRRVVAQIAATRAKLERLLAIYDGRIAA
ncbi:hypothetical protein [Sphingobium sp. LSP13-1-1.1]|uniref:hypothetical protein n=1 Tax=Sphingobium sp. LSP13-1-1.1 TaxID=3135234 RepID=UPI00342CD4A5